jgi:hypothetical protein
LTKRDNTVMRVDNFEVETVLPPPKPVLISTVTPARFAGNETAQPLSVTVYSIDNQRRLQPGQLEHD